MKRPLALIGLTSMLVLTVCFYADSLWIKLLFCLSLLGFGVSLAVRKIRHKISLPVFFAVVLLTVLGFTMFSQFYVKPVQKEYSGKKAEITAVLLDEPELYASRYFYTLKTKSIDGEQKSIKILLGVKSEFKCDVGDTLTFTAELESSGYGRYAADKVYLRCFTYEQVEVSESADKPFYYYIVKLRQNVRSALYMELDADTADLASAVLLGDRRFSGEASESLRRAGLTHIVVVSGLHLSIITLLYGKTFGRRIKNKYINALCEFLLVLFFLFLTGFGKSSIRAAIMLVVLIVSKLFKREGDPLNSLGFAAILLCVNPYIVGDLGVLLSFSATFGIVVFSKPLYEFLTKRLEPEYKSNHKRINKSIRKTAELFTTTLSAVLCTLPVNILFFGKISLVQIFANLFVSPMVKWFMASSALCAVFYFIPVPFVADFFAFFADVIGKVMLYIAKLFASLPMAYVKADYGFVILWLVAVIILFAFAYFIRRNGKGLHFICTLMSVLILTAGLLGHMMYSQNILTVYVTPSKFGQSIVLSSKDGNMLLCSSDNPYALADTEKLLEDIYTEKQLAVITAHKQEAYVFSLFDYNEILMYDNICENDCSVSLWDKGSLLVFERKGMVYQYLAFADTTMLILPDFGDVRDIPEGLRSADVLVASGLIDNMELLSFKTLISNGNDFRSSAVIYYFRNRDISAVSVSDTINFDIVG